MKTKELQELKDLMTAGFLAMDNRFNQLEESVSILDDRLNLIYIAVNELKEM